MKRGGSLEWGWNPFCRQEEISSRPCSVSLKNPVLEISTKCIQLKLLQAERAASALQKRVLICWSQAWGPTCSARHPSASFVAAELLPATGGQPHLLLVLWRAHNSDGLWQHHLVGAVRVQVDAGEESCLSGVSLKHRVRKERTPQQAWMGFFFPTDSVCQVKVGMVKRHSSSDGTEDWLTSWKWFWIAPKHLLLLCTWKEGRRSSTFQATYFANSYYNAQHFPCLECRASCRAVTSHATEAWLSQGTASPDAQHITTTLQEITFHEDGQAFQNHRQHPMHSAPAKRFHSLTLAERPFPLPL